MVRKTNARALRRPRAAALKRELTIYNKNLSGWLKEHQHAYILIKRDVVVGFYHTRDQALEAGYERFGVVPLFVKQVEATEPTYHMPNVLL